MAADDLRDVLGRVGWVARVDAFRRECEEEIDIHFQSIALEHRQCNFVGGPRVGGRLEHDQLAGVQVRRNAFERLHDVGQVRILGLAQRRRHADVSDIHVREFRAVGRGAKMAGLHDPRQLLLQDVRDVGVARIDRVDFAAIDVETGHVEASEREFHRQRESNVAEADDADASLFRQDAVKK